MNKQQFLVLCKEYSYSSHDLSLFERALNLIEEFLYSKKRLAGDSYYDHNIRVAAILVENKTSPEIILTGILNGLQEYKPEKELISLFGKEMTSLLRDLKEIKELKIKHKKIDAEALRKILLATTKDVRVILVKLANKIDNLESVEVFPEAEQKRLAEEVLEIYAPLAYRLGVEKMKNQLEDSAFRILNYRKYKEIADYLEESHSQREKKVGEVIENIRSLADGKVSILAIKGRPKHIYSIYRKIKNRKIKLNQLHDLIGVRAIVPDVKGCYTLLGLLHEHFEPVAERLKDYIANPKTNGYQSIQTTVIFPDNKEVEIQIRTPEMDEFAEEGIAAHWRYKGVKSDRYFEKKIAWLRGILDLKAEKKEFIEAIQVDLFGDKIYCYTPKGDIRELPKGAALLDFAFLIHEEIGAHAVGGRVNGKFVSLKQILHSGDIVEILTNKNQRPRRSWIKIVTSSRARQKIRKSLREHETLAPLHYHKFKPLVKEDAGVLVESPEFPTATCILAKCCLALPGEEIVGLATKKRIISVHQNACRIAEKEEHRLIPVQWKETFNQKIRFYVQAEERSGLLADLLNTIATAGFEVKEAKAKLVNINLAECSFLVIPRDVEQLKELIVRVQKVKGVKKIYFE